MEFKNPRADEIIRDLQQQNLLHDGISTLLEAARYEHKEIDIMKHLFRTASFAKKYSDPAKLDPNDYVQIVKHQIVLTKIRHSAIMPRAITYKQLLSFKAKNMVKLLLKYRDYQNSITLVEQLDKKKLLSSIYENWCATLLRHTS